MRRNERERLARRAEYQGLSITEAGRRFVRTPEFARGLASFFVRGVETAYAQCSDKREALDVIGFRQYAWFQMYTIVTLCGRDRAVREDAAVAWFMREHGTEVNAAIRDAIPAAMEMSRAMLEAKGLLLPPPVQGDDVIAGRFE